MWTSAWRNKFFVLFSLFVGAGSMLPLLAAPINNISIIDPSGGETFTAGVSTNTRLIACFSVGASTPDAGETVTLELLDNGQPVPGGMSPTSFVTQSNTIVYGDSSGLPQFTFFRAGSNLQLRATPSGGGTGDTSAAFTVVPGTAAKLVVLGPGETHQPGRNPATFTGKTGAPLAQEVNQTFAVTVVLTDLQFNQVNLGHTVSFGSNDTQLITLPANGPLTGGTGSFNITITAPSTTRTLSVSDVTDSSVTPGTADVTTSGPPAQEIFPFPNPFNPHTRSITLRFRISDAAKSVKLKIFTQFGQSVWERDVDAHIGFNDIVWDGRNDNGAIVATGIYYAVLEVDGSVKSKKRVGVVK